MFLPVNNYFISELWYIKIPKIQEKFNGISVKQYLSTIYTNRRISQDYYEIVFDWNFSDCIPEPGQFLTVRVSERTVPLLRRPFAFSGFDKDNQKASLIYQKRGTATEILAAKVPGEKLDIIGPIGNSVQLDAFVKECVVVAGGIGLGPMIFTATSAATEGRKVQFIFGAKNKSFIPSKDVFGSSEPVFCTDDGSEGFKGTTIDYLMSLNKNEIENAVIVACGPMPMLKGCHEFAKKNSLPCLVSMEQIMACGVGACMGCTIKVIQEPGYARVCKEGPVFNSKDIIWT